MTEPNLDKLRAQGVAMLDQHWLTLAEHQREILRIAMHGPENDEYDRDLCKMMALVCITEILTRQNARTKDANGNT